MKEAEQLAREKCPKIFASTNVDLFPWHTMSAFPRVLEDIEKDWGTNAVIGELDKLIFNTRPARAGFCTEVLSELVDLKALGYYMHPEWLCQDDPVTRETATTSGWESKEATVGERIEGLEEALPDETEAGPDGEKIKPAVPRKDWPNEIRKIDDLRDYILRRFHGMPRKHDPRKLGEILVETEIMTSSQLEAAVLIFDSKPHPGESFGQFLVKKGLASSYDIIRAICQQDGKPIVDVSIMPIMKDPIESIPIDLLRKSMALPIAEFGNILVIACANPMTFGEKSFLSVMTGKEIELVCGRKEHIVARLDRMSNTESTPSIVKKEEKEIKIEETVEDEIKTARRMDLSPQAIKFREIAASQSKEGCLEKNKEDPASENSPVAKLCKTMMLDAINSGASDIHIETFKEGCRIRLRIDGTLTLYSEYPEHLHDAMISRIKILAGIDISEHRKGQDGKIKLITEEGKERELRVATFPVAGGKESSVLRVLAAAKAVELENIGLTHKDLTRLKKAAEKPHGLILACGPTGSGKTTVLHAILRYLNDGEKKILTAEDPIEITQSGICQTQMNNKAGWTFASALRSFLRADPDVIMVGELRDEETAKIALEASMTGHLVLSTLHTNSSAETCTRLLDLGIDPFTLGDALQAVVSSRLLPKLCNKCKKTRPLGHTEKEALVLEMLIAEGIEKPARATINARIGELERKYKGSIEVAEPCGCSSCRGKGYSGRIAAMEILIPDEKTTRLILKRANTEEIAEAAMACGMVPLKSNALEMVLAGITDIKMARAVCG